MNAIELLKEQHQVVKELFSQIEETEDPEEKEELARELSNNLAAHATIEERLFYPAAYTSETKELLSEAVEEHLAAKRILADLMRITADDESFDAKVTVLKEEIEHHVKEEEHQLFLKVRRELTPEALDALGEKMERLFNREMDGDPAEKVPEEVYEAAPLPSEVPLSERD